MLARGVPGGASAPEPLVSRDEAFQEPTMKLCEYSGCTEAAARRMQFNDCGGDEFYCETHAAHLRALADDGSFVVIIDAPVAAESARAETASAPVAAKSMHAETVPAPAAEPVAESKECFHD